VRRDRACAEGLAEDGESFPGPSDLGVDVERKPPARALVFSLMSFCKASATRRWLLALARWFLPFAVLLAAATLAHGAAGVSPSPPGPGQTVYRLPRDTLPTHLALAGDGSVWMTDEYRGVTRLSSSGGTKDFLTRDGFVLDIVAGPDGSIWVASDSEVVRIDAAGKATRRRGAADAITSAGGAVWVADEGGEGRSPRIERLSTDGAMRAFVASLPRGWLGFNGITGAPDGSLWFTETGEHRAWIGRMTADGRFSHWGLPRSVGDPERIAVGPDGAMWFTGRHAIGRISPGGPLTTFGLGGALAAHDIAAGGDGGLWLTSDICLARITGSGQVTTWPVPGAVQLEGIAADPDGSFWLADRAGNAIRHFTPSGAAPAPCGAPSLARQAGSTAATVAFQRTERFRGVDYFTDIHIHIARKGHDLFSEAVPGLRRYAAFSDSTSLIVRDLDGDGEPEVTLVLNWNGTHCCSWSRIYRYDPARNTYAAQNHFWGNVGAEPVVRDLNGDRRPEFRSLDDRFSERFTSFVGSVTPIQIWSYRHGSLRDVTRRYPRLIRRDAARIWRLYLKYRKSGARGILPAWMADEDLLGRAPFADRVLAEAAARGELKRNDGVGPRGTQAYISAVKALLRKTGYSR
jgi:streptogramin lyase